MTGIREALLYLHYFGLYQTLARLTCTVMMIGMSGAGFAAPNKTGGLAGAGASIVGQSN